MDANSIPTDFPWREAIGALPPWARQMIASAAGVDEKVFGISGDDAEPSSGHDRSDPPGRGRPSGRQGAGSGGSGSGGSGSGGSGSVMFGPGGFGLGGFGDGGFGPAGFGPGFMRALIGGGRGPWPGGKPRANRGDVRSAILSLLAEEPMHGYQLLQEMAKRSGGAWRPSPGSVYPTLSQLEDEGLVKGKKDGGRRIFTLTDDGRAAAADREDEAPWDSVGDRFADEFAQQADEGLMGLREEIASLAAAVMAVATSDSDDHITRAKSMLTATRRDLYRLLAED